MELIRASHLYKSYSVRTGLVGRRISFDAVMDVNLVLGEGQTVGLVGESGSGKSTLGKCLLGLEKPTSGTVFYRDQDVSKFSNSQKFEFRKKAQIIFQDPYASLNPRMTVETILEEPILIHQLCNSAASRRAYVCELLEMVGLREDVLQRYPHEFSGGQRQRIGIARALAVKPELLICDEPVSALDVSVQAQVLNLLMDLQEELKLTLLFISHDLRVVEHVCQTVAVMYLGQIVEHAHREKLFAMPSHPYTEALLSAIPQVDRAHRRKRIVLEGDPPSVSNRPSGCAFHPRCIKAVETCQWVTPTLQKVRSGSQTRCTVTQTEQGSR